MRKLPKSPPKMPKNYSKFSSAIIIGWDLKPMDFFETFQAKTLATPYGKINYFQRGNWIFIPRHGIKENIPPHKINYWANILGLKKLGAKQIFSFNSVGSLKKYIKPGELLIPSDFIDPNPPTFYEKKVKFITPELSQKLRKKLIAVLRRLKLKFRDGGVYFQTKGPRLETKAEIRMIKNFADVVGMTMPKEATLAKELDLEYISLCSVDNYAHGIGKRSLSAEEIKKGQLKTREKFEKIIKEILK